MSIDRINKLLVDRYGLDVATGLPKYRVVWSDDQREKRWVEYSASYNGVPLPLTKKEVEEKQKYPFVRGRHIFERLEFTDNPELVSPVTYECIYVFQDKLGLPLPVVEWAVDYIMDRILNRQKTIHETEDEFMKRQEDLYFQILDNDRPYLATMMSLGEAAFIDSKKVFTK